MAHIYLQKCFFSTSYDYCRNK